MQTAASGNSHFLLQSLFFNSFMTEAIFRANQCTGFYMITVSVMKKLISELVIWIRFFLSIFIPRLVVAIQHSQPVFTCSNSIMETPIKCVKSVQS